MQSNELAPRGSHSDSRGMTGWPSRGEPIEE